MYRIYLRRICLWKAKAVLTGGETVDVNNNLYVRMYVRTYERTVPVLILANSS